MHDDPVVPLDPDRLAAIEAKASGTTFALTMQPAVALALVAAARKLDLMLSHESIYAECDALRAEVQRLDDAFDGVVRERNALIRDGLALRAEVERLRGEVYAVREGAAEFRQAITEALPENPNDLLTPEQHAELNEALGRIAATRNPCWGQRPPTDGGPDA